MSRRLVRCSPAMLATARQLFPSGGSAPGRPSFELFERLLLRAAIEAFGRDFEGQAAEDPALPIRHVITQPTPLFPEPLVFYALLVGEDVEIVDVVVDPDYLDTIGDDPAD